LKNVIVEITEMKRKLGHECLDVNLDTVAQVRQHLGHEATLSDLVEVISKF